VLWEKKEKEKKITVIGMVPSVLSYFANQTQGSAKLLDQYRKTIICSWRENVLQQHQQRVKGRKNKN